MNVLNEWLLFEDDCKTREWKEYQKNIHMSFMYYVNGQEYVKNLCYPK